MGLLAWRVRVARAQVMDMVYDSASLIWTQTCARPSRGCTRLFMPTLPSIIRSTTACAEVSSSNLFAVRLQVCAVQAWAAAARADGEAAPQIRLRVPGAGAFG